MIRLYHEHGESEQYHSEIKTDMDVERFPSGKFDTNELVLELTVLAYNILRVITSLSWSLPFLLTTFSALSDKKTLQQRAGCCMNTVTRQGIDGSIAVNYHKNR